MQLELPLAIAPVTAPEGSLRYIQLGSEIVGYRFRRARRRSIGIVVDDDGLRVAAPGYTPIAEVEASAAKIWDPEAALARVDGDRKLFLDVVEIFCQEGPKLLSKLQDAVTAADYEAMERTAHSIKGEVSYFAAPLAVETAKKIEASARNHDLEVCRAMLGDLQTHLEQLRSALLEVRQEVTP